MRNFILLAIFSFFLPLMAKAEKVYFDNVIIVLDASGSMNERMKGNMGKQRINRIQAAKTAIKEVMKTIPQTTQVGLLVFGGSHNGWIYPLGPRDDQKLFSSLDKVNAGGGTPLGKYMKMGADQLLNTRKKQYGYGSYRLLIVTDGEATDANQVEEYTPDIISRGIITDVIGVDMKRAHTLATKVHSYRSANDPSSLKKAIQEVFAEVGKTAQGKSGDEAFAELEGFPEDLSMAVISAWGSSGNHPIGSSPKKVKGASNKTVHTHTTIKSRPPKKGNGFVKTILKFLGVGLIILIAVIVSSIKRKRS